MGSVQARTEPWPVPCRLESYHHMCRYFSGFFHHHPLLADFDYYWRIEPDVHYYCNLDYDPFLFMQQRCGPRRKPGL